MKKHLQFFVLLAALLLPMLAQAQRVTIGTGTSTSYSPSPFCNFYNNGMSQTLYLASEINTSGVIDTIWLYSASSGTVASTNLHIYLATTTNTTLSSFLPASAFDEVYAATGSAATLGGTVGWVPFVLDEPYYYAGTDNLVVCCTRQGSDYSTTVTWQYTSQSGRMVYRNSDSDASYGDITSTVGSASASSYRFNTRFHFDSNYVAPSCQRPYSVAASNVSSSTADISWVDTNTSVSGFRLYFYPTNAPSAIDSVELASADTAYQLTGLASNTFYSVDLCAICDDATVTRARSTSFRTACSALETLPYVMNFESEPTTTSSTANSTWASCWHHLNNGTSYGGYPYVNSSTTYNHTPNGSKGLYWYGSTTTGSYGDYHCIVFPGVDTTLYPINSLQVTMWAKSSSTSYYPTFQVGVMTDPNDITTFTQVGTANVGNNTAWGEYITDLSNYTGYGRFVAIKAVRPTSAWYAYVDDLQLSLTPACPRVENLSVSNVTPSSADLSWTETGNGTSWTVEYGPQGFTPGDTSSTIAYATDTVITLTGLTPNTQYDVYVTVDCGSDVGGVNQTAFRTLCTLLGSLPYTQNFESASTGGTTSATWVNCWQRLNNGSTYFGYPYVSASTTYNHTVGGTKGLYWFNSTTPGTYGDYQCIVLPGVDTDIYPVNTLQLKFWAKATSTSYSPVFQVGVMSDPYDISTFQLVSTVNVGANTAWTEFSTAFGHFTGQGQFVAIRAMRPASSWYACVDDVTLEEAPTCPSITTITAHTTASWAQLSWDYDLSLGITPTSYVVEYRYAGDSSSLPVSQTVYDNQLLLSGLDPDSTYEVSIYADCGTSTGAVETSTFRMQALPCLEWDTAGTGSGSSSTATYPVLTSGASTTDVMPVNGQYNYSYANHLYLANEINSGAVYLSGIDFQYAGASPMVNTTNCSIFLCHTTMTTCDAFAPAADLQLVYEGSMNCTSGWNHFEFNRGTFAYNGTSNLMVGVVKNGTGTESGATFYYATASGSMSHRVYRNDAPYTLADMATVTAGTSVWRPNMRLTTGGSGGSDCITQANCSAPYATITNLTGHTVSLRWIPGYQETSWDVDYRAAGASTWTNFATATSDDSITITGLNATTSYEVRVGALCSDTTIYHVRTFRTPCDAISVPFTETFETYGTGTTAFPTCWVKKGTTADRPYVHATTSYGRNNTHGLYFFSAASGYCYAIMPPTVNSIDSLQVSFWARQYSASYNCSFVVGVMSDPNDLTTFVAVDTVSPAGITYEMFEVPLNGYTGTGNYIAFSSIINSGSSNYLMLDDVTVDYIPSCPRITTANTRNVTEDEATIYWNYSLASEFEVEYGPAGFSRGSGTLVTTTEDSIRLIGLSPSTTYDAYVSAICGSNDTSNASLVTFSTQCGRLNSLPYVMDFESVATGTSTTGSTFVNCWGHLNNGTSYGGYPFVSSSTASYNHTAGGSKYLYWYATTTTGTYGDYYCVVLPAVDTTLYPTNTLQLDFWAKATSASYSPTFFVGVMSDPANINSFQPVDTISFTGTEWNLYEVPLTRFTGNGSNVAIKAVRPTSAWYAAVDDITLREAPSCFHPTDAAATTVTCTSATVHWTPGDSAQTDFVVRYGLLGCNIDTCQDIFVQYADSILLTGLDTGTFYDFYVATLCSAYDTTPWESLTFRTLAGEPVSTFPYLCTFAGTQGNSWELAGLGQANQWYVGTAAYNGAADNMGLYVSNNNGVSNAYTNTTISSAWAYRTMNLTAGEYAFSFDWRCNGESSYDYLRPFVVPATETLIGGQLPGGASAYTFATTAGVPAGWIDLANRTTSPYVLNLQSTWQTHTGTFTITQSGTYNLVFCWANDGSGGTTPPAAVDNIYINRNTCPQVVDLAADNVTADSMYLSWGSVGTESSWRVELDSAGTVTTFNVTDSSIAIGGLTPNTQYTVRVYANCGAGDTSMANTIVLFTPCVEMSVPFTENFDSYTGTTTYSSGVYPNCWSYVLNGSSTYQAASYQPFVYSNSTYAHSGSNTLRLYGVGYFSLPPMNVPLDSLQLSFWNYTTSTYYGLEVGVMEGNTFVPVEVVTAASASTHVHNTVYFAQYTGSSRIIAFRNFYTTSATTGYSYNYLDDIEVSYAPTCMPVSDIEAVGASTTSIDVDWIDNSAASSWQVRCALGSAAGTTITTSSHPVTIAGLDTLTAYNIYVRPICSAGDTGQWSDAVRLMTSFCDNSQIASTGNPTTTSYYAPVNNFYKYTLSEVIIDSAELGGAQDLSAISYFYSYATAMTSKNSVDIYLQPTNKTAFSSTTDVVALDTATALKVYSGALNCSQGWNIFQFDTTFSYSGSGNLLVIVDDNSNAYNGSAYVWGTAPCTGNKTLYYYSDSYDCDPENPASYSGSKAVAAWRPAMQLISCNSVSCHAPVVTSTTHDYESATATWTGTGSYYEVAVKQTVASAWPAETPVTGNTYTFSNLLPATNYTYRVRQDCSLDSAGFSDWREVQFTTDSLPCFAPDSLTAAVLDNANATFTWQRHAGTSENAWIIHAWNANDTNVFDTVTGGVPSTTLSVFRAGATYNAAVCALCGSQGTIEGDYGDTIQFTMATCPDVANAISTGHTFNSVTLDWNDSVRATSWLIEYGNYGFSQGSGTTVTATSHPYTVTGLADEQTYDFYIRAVCGTDWQSEHWSSRVRVTTSEAPAETFTVTAIPNNPQWGSVNGGGTYAPNDTVTLTATAASGYEFIEWNDHNTDNPRTFTVTCDTSFTAVFAAIPSYTITVTANNSDWGSVTGGGTFQRGTDIQISATANAGYHFDRWNDGSTDNPHTITVMADATYTANFVSDSAAMFTVTLTVNDETMGTVNGAGTYPEGSVVTIEALPYEGFEFVSWSDGDNNAARDLTITADVELMATFRQHVGIDEVNGVATCTIYPNPAGNAATISVSGANGQLRIAVLDMSGRTVASETLECSGDCEKRMDVENLAQGTYFVRITGEQVNLVKKLIVR